MKIGTSFLFIETIFKEQFSSGDFKVVLIQTKNAEARGIKRHFRVTGKDHKPLISLDLYKVLAIARDISNKSRSKNHETDTDEIANLAWLFLKYISKHKPVENHSLSIKNINQNFAIYTAYRFAFEAYHTGQRPISKKRIPFFFKTHFNYMLSIAEMAEKEDLSFLEPTVVNHISGLLSFQ